MAPAPASTPIPVPAGVPTTPAPTPTRFRPGLYLGLVVVLVVGATALTWYLRTLGTETTEDAYVDGNVVQVTTQIGGTVTAIAADNTDHVRAGDLLLTLNPVDQEIQLERTKAALAKATRQARTQYFQVQQLRAELEQRRNDVRKARADLERRAQLSANGAVSREEFSHSEDILRNAEAGLEATRQLLAQRLAMVDGTSLRTHPDVLAAATNLRDAYVAHTRTVVPAPVDGTVARRSVQVGQRISPGMALMAVVPLDALWVNANFKESQLEHLRVGQPVTLNADAYRSDVIFHGRIVGLDAGTGSAFALLPAQNATGNWIKVTQRVPVRIALEPQEIAHHPLRIGLSMRVAVDTHERGGPLLSTADPPVFVYRTKVFDKELAQANALVESVIRENEGTSAANASAQGAQ